MGATWLKVTVGIVVYLDRDAARDWRGAVDHRLRSHLSRSELRLRERDDIGVSDCV